MCTSINSHLFIFKCHLLHWVYICVYILCLTVSIFSFYFLIATVHTWRLILKTVQYFKPYQFVKCIIACTFSACDEQTPVRKTAVFIKLSSVKWHAEHLITWRTYKGISSYEDNRVLCFSVICFQINTFKPRSFKAIISLLQLPFLPFFMWRSFAIWKQSWLHAAWGL